MDLKLAIEILTYHQKWRLGKVEDYKYSPKEITMAIDVLLNYLKTNAK